MFYCKALDGTASDFLWQHELCPITICSTFVSRPTDRSVRKDCRCDDCTMPPVPSPARSLCPSSLASNSRSRTHAAHLVSLRLIPPRRPTATIESRRVQFMWNQPLPNSRKLSKRKKPNRPPERERVLTAPAHYPFFPVSMRHLPRLLRAPLSAYAPSLDIALHQNSSPTICLIISPVQKRSCSTRRAPQCVALSPPDIILSLGKLAATGSASAVLHPVVSASICLHRLCPPSSVATTSPATASPATPRNLSTMPVFPAWNNSRRLQKMKLQTLPRFETPDPNLALAISASTLAGAAQVQPETATRPAC